MKGIHILVFILILNSLIPVFAGEPTHYAIRLSTAPGSTTSQSVSLLWGEGGKTDDDHHYSIYCNGKLLDTTAMTYYDVKNLHSDSSYHFQVKLQNKKNKVIYNSNLLYVRTSLSPKYFNIKDFGAVGDGKSLDTKAIQQAIDACNKQGIVVVPKGVYLTGALFFKSYMTLYIEEGAILKGSSDLAHYPIVRSRFEGIEGSQYASLINGGTLLSGGIQEFSIRGKGIIDGNEENLINQQKKEGLGYRGRILSLMNGENICLEGVTFLQSPAWGVHFIYCMGVTIKDVYINTRFDPETGRKYKIHNGDGLTIDSSKDIVVYNTTISSQDDNVSIKSGRDNDGRRVAKSTDNIKLFDCKFLGGFGVVVGSEMAGNVRNVLVNNCFYENTACVSQLKAPWGRGGVIENITFKNIVHTDSIHHDNMWFRGAICIDQYYGIENPDYTVRKEVDENMPTIRDAWYENITISKKYGFGMYLCGRPENYVKNIYFRNVEIHSENGIYGRHLDGIHLKQTKIIPITGETFEWVQTQNIQINQ